MLPLQAAQAQAKPIVIASADSAKRFMPLKREAVSSATAPVKVRNAKRKTNRRRSGLHSDSASLRKGFMRVDRKMLVVNRSKKRNAVSAPVELQQAAGLIKPDAPVLSNNPILDLFGADGADGATFGVTRRGERAAGKAGYGWPVSAKVAQRISSGYGNRKDPFTGKPAFHGGIDIAAATGTPVLAAASGTVQDVGTSKRYGKYVSIQHPDGNVSWYGHLSAQNIAKGVQVRKGQPIGRVGSTGRSTGPHLDFRIKDGDKFLNPSRLIGTGPRTLQLAQTAATR